MEIRTQVLEYLTSRIHALRTQQQNLKNKSANPTTTEAPTESAEPTEAPAPATDDDIGTTKIFPGNFENITAIRSNTMKFLPNFFGRHQLSKIFICFPDPHFKARKHKARIISESLNAEYAYALRPGGLLYTITDVEEYHHWVLRHFQRQPEDAQKTEGETVHAPGIKDIWERVSDEDLAADPCVRVMQFETEESKKVTRNNGKKFVAVFRRLADPEWPAS
jgi:tRNA (guanine-N7-)-methyltransferase